MTLCEWKEVIYVIYSKKWIIHKMKHRNVHFYVHTKCNFIIPGNYTIEIETIKTNDYNDIYKYKIKESYTDDGIYLAKNFDIYATVTRMELLTNQKNTYREHITWQAEVCI